MKKLVFYICLCGLVSGITAQTGNNLGETLVTSLADSVRIDSLSLIPGSWTLIRPDGSPIPDSLYRVDAAGAWLYLLPGITQDDLPLRLRYRHFPVLFTRSFFKRDLETTLILQERGVDPFRSGTAGGSPELPFAGSAIDRRGSLSRGLQFGNNRDASVSSNLNLQLSGPLSDRLNILAAISDENIPIQPDGTSQQIQDFDRIFIELFNEKLSLRVGDLDLHAGESEFLRFSRRVQGVSFSLGSGTEEEGLPHWETSTSGAVAKGKFSRNRFNGIEGNQGPYRLRGNENESYIVILAGSERVYLDGELMRRGEENDYVIDYNQAELRFTPSRPITKDKRIIVEFEYSEKSYARYLLSTRNSLVTKRGRYWINLVSEQDGKNQPLQQSLSADQKSLLASIGDELDLAVVPNARATEFLPDRVLYRKTDSLVDGTLYPEVYVVSTDPTQSLFQVGFSYLGPGKGNYIQVASPVNGRAFEWVAPVNGVPQGDHEPVVRLVTPRKNQVLSAGMDTRLSEHTKVYLEMALSNQDLNTFSEAGNQDNLGSALQARLEQRFFERDSGKTYLGAKAAYRFISGTFRPLERIRSVEFERDWNLEEGITGVPEHLLDLEVNYLRKELLSGNYRAEFLSRENDRALRQNLDNHLSRGGLSWDFSGSWLQSENNLYKTLFLRHQASLSQEIGVVRFGIKEQGEKNLWQLPDADSLLAQSFAWQQWEGFLDIRQEEKRLFSIAYRNRTDRIPGGRELLRGTRANELSMDLELGHTEKHRLRAGISYRSLSLLTDSLGGLQDESTLLGRIRYGFSWLGGLVSGNTYLETGTGQEQKKEFTYLEVAAGQGVYVWKDFNGNGIQELDEFEVAKFQDEASYIRITVPGLEMIPVTHSQFSQVIQILPARVIGSDKGNKTFLSRFSNQLAWQLSRKSLSEDLAAYLDPFAGAVADSQIVALNTSLRNTLSLNRGSPVFGLDYLVQDQQSKILLVNGPESRRLLSHSLHLRVKISGPLSWLQEWEQSGKDYASAYFPARDYRISSFRQQSTLQMEAGLSFNLDLSYRYQERQNAGSGVRSRVHEFGTEFRFHRPGKGRISMNLNYLDMRYNGEQNNFLAYEMLEGFQPGKNLTWGIRYQQKLISGIEIVMDYGGRSLPGARVVHTGSIQARAVF